MNRIRPGADGAPTPSLASSGEAGVDVLAGSGRQRQSAEPPTTVHRTDPRPDPAILPACANCGSSVAAPHSRFCSSCGSALYAPAQVDDQTWVATGPPHRDVYGRPPSGSELRAAVADASSAVRGRARRHGLTADGLAHGDWRGAVTAALGGVGAIVALLAVYPLLLAATGLFFSEGAQWVALAAIGVAQAVGGGVTIGGEAYGVGAGGGFSLMPLGASVVGFGVIGVVFLLRRLRVSGVTTSGEVILQTVRIWVVFLAALLVVTMVGRIP